MHDEYEKLRTEIQKQLDKAKQDQILYEGALLGIKELLDRTIAATSATTEVSASGTN